MAFVPGFQHDVFVSYAHGDDRGWINRFLDRLSSAVKLRLGVEADVWIDEADLHKTGDFRRNIPDALRSSAVFLLFASPTYIRSTYCVMEECAAFEAAVRERRRERFRSTEFQNELFVLRCLLLPVEENEHWELFRGATDIVLCDESDSFAIGSPEFEASMRRATGELVNLLRRMRNHSSPVFLYPAQPTAEIESVHRSISDELTAQSYRLLPDRQTNLPGQLREAALSVFLLGKSYNESARELADLASKQDKPWVVWSPPEANANRAVEQEGFCKYIEQLDSERKTYLSSNIAPLKIKEEILGLLRPRSKRHATKQGKPRVYLIYNWREQSERGNAGLIVLHYRSEFVFELPDDPIEHSSKLAHSDGVLLIWGKADEKWCSQEFAEMVQIAKRAGSKGLCVFDPEDPKKNTLAQIREKFNDLHIAEEFGAKFEPARLEGFFRPLRKDLSMGI